MSVDMAKLGALVSEQMDAIQETYGDFEEAYEITNCVLIANIAKKGSDDTGEVRSRAPRGQNAYLTLGLLDATRALRIKEMEVPK